MSDLAEVPGYREAWLALDRVTEGRFTPSELHQVVSTVMGVSRPYVQAEVLADMSDYLAELELYELSNILDNVSAGIRKAVGSA